jgi:hypothetical protein
LFKALTAEGLQAGSEISVAHANSETPVVYVPVGPDGKASGTISFISTEPTPAAFISITAISAATGEPLVFGYLGGTLVLGT